jgi:serine/threonine-protein kinase
MTAPFREGDVVAGKYRIDRVLGEGGMGVVLAATHVDLDQRVAIKFLLAHMLENDEIVERFAREARAASKIKGDHAVRILDVGRIENGAPYMVMEYLEGEDLESLLLKRGQLPAEEAVRYLLEACQALAEAHAAGIVHRDLKPANLFLARTPDHRQKVKVLDFGISKMSEDGGRAITRTSSIMGTPHYMSPEQLMSSKQVDARSDIWALGVILYELLTGAKPFDGDTMPEIVAMILQTQYAPVKELAPGVPDAVADAVALCLKTSPKDRFQNVGEFAHALASFAGDDGAAAFRIARVLGTELPSVERGESLSLDDFGAMGDGATLAGDTANEVGAAVLAARTSVDANSPVTAISGSKPPLSGLVDEPRGLASSTATDLAVTAGAAPASKGVPVAAVAAVALVAVGVSLGLLLNRKDPGPASGINSPASVVTVVVTAPAPSTSVATTLPVPSVVAVASSSAPPANSEKNPPVAGKDTKGKGSSGTPAAQPTTPPTAKTAPPQNTGTVFENMGIK